MPSRILFSGKMRPKGLEFGSCQECQNSTRREEQVVAMISRFYPDPKTVAERKEMKSLFRSVAHNFPGLLPEMHIDQLLVLRDIGEDAKRLPNWDFLDISSPRVRGAVQKFAAKLAIALHFELTKQIVPRGAAIFVQHYTNFVAIVEGMPVELMEVLGEEKMLSMGSNHSAETFSYQSVILTDEPTTIHMAYFRQSFALLLVVYPRFSDVPAHAISHIVVH
ncbi:hypothetical protein NOI24_16295 [Neorhizobium galegae]|uniref:hypothetical protein n=1 Tax=Neorhizobium galegae TaxID=399 RepID=UPI0021073832|nr:hypothetical protein [Neorhizobium galegae]MCQ1772871.1 hypothetical protein [Neorhizobium galegae]MCQ1799182.1 hypothetical protein [Neorhizobium galegae]